MAQFGDGGELVDQIAAEISHHVSPIVGAWRYHDKYPDSEIAKTFDGPALFQMSCNAAALSIIKNLDLDA